MRIALLEPFFTGSHAAWAKGYVAHSRHDVQLLTLPGRHWKWRMHGAAITFARKLTEAEAPDLILASDMLDVATFRGLTGGKLGHVPLVLYMHENQLTYPWSTSDPDPKAARDRHYAFLNFTSALAADAVWFNSSYHQQAFLTALPLFLRGFPDHREQATVDIIAQKSRVMFLGLNLRELQNWYIPKQWKPPLILWNHRWEYDKAPEAFFEVLEQVSRQGVPFELAVLGESFGRSPKVFAQAQVQLAPHIVQWGYANSREEYAQWLSRATVLPVTARHDFFGASTVEAMAQGVLPLLPHRLAYPEHIPDGQRGMCLYANRDMLVEKLISYLENPYPAPAALREYVERYDWQYIAPQYDLALEEMIKDGSVGMNTVSQTGE